MQECYLSLKGQSLLREATGRDFNLDDCIPPDPEYKAIKNLGQYMTQLERNLISLQHYCERLNA